MPKILVFQHVPHEGLGNFEGVFRQQGLEISLIPSFDRDLSAIKLNETGCGGMVVMGGPMSANDHETLPFIREELRLIEEALEEGVPFLGVCLGAQMLAKVLGSKVYPGNKKEIGWYPLYLQEGAPQDLVFKDFPRETLMFQWHGETFNLPKGSKLLASSDLFPHQAFAYEGRAYGLQFHPEITLPMIREWVTLGKSEIAQAGLPKSSEEILADSEKYSEGLKILAEVVGKGFASLVK